MQRGLDRRKRQRRGGSGGALPSLVPRDAGSMGDHWECWRWAGTPWRPGDSRREGVRKERGLEICRGIWLISTSISDVSGTCLMDGRLCQGADTGVAVQGVPAP